ncbi:endothelin-converting enzyme 1-like isoform X2 [Cotesia typhae]
MVIEHLSTFLRSLVFKEDKPTEANFDWIGFTATAKKLGFTTNFFLDFKPNPTYDAQNSSLRYSIQMAPSYFDPLVNGNNATQREMYLQYITDVRQLMGEDVDQKHLKNMYDFECKLAEITVPESKYHTNDITVEDLQKRWPSINWKRLIDEVLMPFADPNEKPVITIWNDAALTKFEKLMKETPGLVYAHYAIWKATQFGAPFLTKGIREAHKAFHNQLGHPAKPRKIVCEEAVKKYAQYAIQDMFLTKHKKSVEIIEVMTEAIKKEMVKIIEESKILDNEDKQEGIDILEDMPVTIGPSSNLTDSKKLEKFYEGVEVFKDNYLKTILSLNVFIAKKEYSNAIHKEFFQYLVKRIHVPGLPDNYAGHLYIPLNMIQSETFNVDRPMYMNYGAAGAFIAREMFKSLDHLGRHWLDNGTELANDHLDCFRNQTAKISEPNLKNAIRQHTERDYISYNVGFRAVYAAYQNFVKKSGVEPMLPRLDYSQETVFWMSFLLPVCFANAEPNQLRAYGEPRLTMFEYMIMGIFANVPQISTHFGCRIGSNMNPKNKCSWL